jgi:predicted transporter
VSECDACGRQECFDGLIVECFVCITAVLIACTVRRTVTSVSSRENVVSLVGLVMFSHTKFDSIVSTNDVMHIL